jgi:hypothetical protein
MNPQAQLRSQLLTRTRRRPLQISQTDRQLYRILNLRGKNIKVSEWGQRISMTTQKFSAMGLNESHQRNKSGKKTLIAFQA